MAIIQTMGQVEKLAPPWYQGIQRSSIQLYNHFNYDYATLYRVQSNVRTCVDFLSRNIAQLGLHQFLRVSDNDRKRLIGFGMSRIINRPLPAKYKITRYRMINALMSDLGIYFNAYLLKVRDQDSGDVLGLLRIPPIYISPEGSLVNTGYRLEIGSFRKTIDPDEIIHIRGYNPENPIYGLSPLETLRRILAEEDSAGRYREGLWKQGNRMSGYIQRPADAPDWSDTARERFLQEFNDLYAGDDNSGKTALIEDGMEWVSAGFSPRESEYLSGRKLTREECARAFHIPLPMVGILDHATLTNVREQHKQLYQDSLGPWCTMIEQDFDLQLLPEFAGEGIDIEQVYSEFNIMEKLQGDFEEQIKALQSAVGRPYMTPNEGRARLNLPSLGGDADQLATPLNVIIGGQASPRDSAPKGGQHSQKQLGEGSKQFNSYHAELSDRYQIKYIEIFSNHYRRQERAILSRVNPAISEGKADLGSGVWWDSDRWNDELFEDLLKINLLTAQTWAEMMFEKTGVELNNYQAFDDRLIPYMSEHSRIQAEDINQTTEIQIGEALDDPDPLAAVKNVFKIALTSRVIQQAISSVNTASNFGAFEAAKASQLLRKTWRVNSGNPRESHAALDGVSVGIRENFPNGLRWPGDPSGSAEELAGCQCSVEFSR